MDTKKLRQKILDLAIRGKLVPQDPNDEPASVLLERIRAEKERLIKEGKIKRSKKTATDTPHNESKEPFELPSRWSWCRLEDLVSPDCTLGYGIVQPMEDVLNGIPVVRPVDLTSPIIGIKGLKRIDEKISHSYQRTILKGGEILFCVRASVGKVGIASSQLKGANVTRGISPLRFDYEYLTKYVFYHLQSLYSQTEIKAYSRGATLQQINVEDLKILSIALPPFAEQKHIVNEIERWFTVIDTLESNEGDLLKAIDQAKSKILDLAIHGKLVPQDPNDEPAIELLKRINPNFESNDVEDYPFVIPQSWEWTTIGTCSKYRSTSIDPSKHKDQLFELYSVPTFETGMPEFVSGANISSSKKIVEEGDVLLCKINPHLNRTWIVKHHKKDFQCIASSEWIVFRNGDIDSQYLMRCFTSSYFLKLMLSNVSGVGGSLMRAQPSSVEKYPFPLPPLAEQHRIVAKIEQLFNEIDKLKK